jgi:arabinogalactan endo-1,4-beta-galactosidase
MLYDSNRISIFNLLMGCALITGSPGIRAQPFYFGADLSYVNELEDCGAVYKVGDKPHDPYTLFKDRGCNLVRLRLWHTPSWYDNLNNGIRYSDFEDVRQSIQRAKDQNMDVLLDFHLSDNWADPSHQVAPDAWSAVLDDLEILQDSLYQYIYHTLSLLAEDDLLPDLVQIGNETNKGILQSQQNNDQGWSLNWPRNKALFNTAIDAVRDIETAYNADIKVALHIADPEDITWLLPQFWSNGVRDFDIIGLSYYYSFHPVVINYVAQLIRDLKETYPGKEVMILETAYAWTLGNADGANNILNANYPGYTPTSPDNQLEWMIALTQQVINSGGKGVVYWEPAWVSTTCSTQWAQGSHWDNATFFDFTGKLLPDGGIGWMAHEYDFTLSSEEMSVQFASVNIYFVSGEIVIEKSADMIWNNPLRMELNSMDGEALLSKSFAWDQRDYVMRVPVQNLVPGCYVVRLNDRGNFVKSELVFVH